jgi:hypothetical protein
VEPTPGHLDTTRLSCDKNQFGLLSTFAVPELLPSEYTHQLSEGGCLLAGANATKTQRKCFHFTSATRFLLNRNKKPVSVTPVLDYTDVYTHFYDCTL